MLNFILQKIINKKWMVLSLLIGNLLLIAIAVSNPMYSQAALQRTLVQDLNNYLVEKNTYPGKMGLTHNFSPYKKMEISDIKQTGELFDQMIAELELTPITKVSSYSKNNVHVDSDIVVDKNASDPMITLEAYSDFASHVEILHGDLYASEPDEHLIEAIVNERTFKDQKLVMGSEFVLTQITDANEVPYRVRVVGIFREKDPQDPYWADAPSYWSDVFVIDTNVYEEIIANPEKPDVIFDAGWHVVLDHKQMKAEKAEEYLQLIDSYMSMFEKRGTSGETVAFERTLQNFLPKAQKLNTTITVLQVPIFILLAAFIFMVSRQMLENEQNEISVFKSRGASKRQIIGVYLLQSVLISGVGVIGGLPLGVLVCKVLGASNAFLEFVQRTALPLELGPRVWLFAGIAALFSVATMVLPVFRFANVNIVAHKRQKTGRKKRSWWQMVFLDVILLAVALYGQNQFSKQQDFLAEQVMDGASLDPMLYLCSSIFMLGAGLLVLRLLPLLIHGVFLIAKKWWPPALYASFLRILRSNNNQGFLVVFLVLTVSMGIFNTQTARTINANSEERIRYVAGADIVLQESWLSASGDTIAGASSDDYVEPDFGRYLELDGVEHAAKVYVNDRVSVTTEDSAKLNSVKLMGIHTKDFGQTAWFKESLLSRHWYHYLNTMAQNTNAILVSANFRDVHGYEVGDVITYYNGSGRSVRGVIYGFVDYWPSYSPVTRTKGSDGIYRQSENYLIVAHLSQVQASWGVQPYQVWMKTTGSSQFIYSFIEENKISVSFFNDASANVVAMKNDPVFQGTNGILTIGFIIVLVLCAAGFLIYWILSIQSRTLQFGIFRAMGMGKSEILSMLVNEQIFISGLSIAAGVLVGQIGSKLYVPLIQIAYSSADKVIPLEIISAGSDYLRLGTVIGLMIAVCMAVLAVLISKIKITQALKLGED